MWRRTGLGAEGGAPLGLGRACPRPGCCRRPRPEGFLPALLLKAGLPLLIHLVSGPARGAVRKAGPLPCSLEQVLLFLPSSPDTQALGRGLPPAGWVGLRAPP